MFAFLIIGAVGILLLVFSLVLGDLLDGLFDFGGDLFSGAALAGFLGAFGFVGALAYDSTDNLIASMAIGIVSGLVVGAGAGFASYRLKQGGDEANVRTGDLTGHPGTVISTIPDDGYGEVSIVVAGHITKLNARAEGGLATGTPVTITAILSATAVLVERRA
ncbi:hypothetical protein [Nocardioides sp. AE5]|uniref:NfeD family protein n=1 Tax=Nocardioides sp. AE5 TaxID=2962573 RepID=UPI002881E5C8|nr:hypothetical protein [Nocardioides sp. AE5]MDT0201162.1 hypothetical protein [Nocardioides sp. AE5]